mmetsp:Transcript_76406/g.205605  ORF Transcript_76406/g.205605 Transcript_76406/m.205605 type:complete len:137 (-) Transcript_76406:2-412(-)
MSLSRWTGHLDRKGSVLSFGISTMHHTHTHTQSCPPPPLSYVSLPSLGLSKSPRGEVGTGGPTTVALPCLPPPPPPPPLEGGLLAFALASSLRVDLRAAARRLCGVEVVRRSRAPRRGSGDAYVCLNEFLINEFSL